MRSGSSELAENGQVERAFSKKTLVASGFMRILRKRPGVQLWYLKRLVWLEKNSQNLHFESVTGVSLEKMLLVFFGTFAVSKKGSNLPIYDPTEFFKQTVFNEDEIKQITKLCPNFF